MPAFTSSYTFAAALVIATAALPLRAAAQDSKSPPPAMDQHMSGPHHMMHRHGIRLQPGQDAFGAIQEIVRILEADPKTDWSKVNLEALRQHFVDMNEVTLKANASAKPVDGGLEIAVTGDGRTLEAIQRMVTAHAQVIEATHLNGWRAKTELLPGGVMLTVTASNPKEAQHIRGLGFIGTMVSGHHHQPHHLAMARGERMH